jgi:hypothetical protein
MGARGGGGGGGLQPVQAMDAPQAVRRQTAGRQTSDRRPQIVVDRRRIPDPRCMMCIVHTDIPKNPKNCTKNKKIEGRLRPFLKATYIRQMTTEWQMG